MNHSLTENRALSSHRSSEFGQVLILIGFAFAAMLGIMALAIDGGRVFADRRTAQNTADTSSFAGGLVIAQADFGDDPTKLPPDTTLTDAIDKAFIRAVSNHYDDSDPDVDVSVTVTEDALFEEGSYYFLVRVEITSRIDGMFTPIVYSGQLVNTVYAVTKVKPVQGIAYGNSLFASAPDECNTMHFTGTVDILIEDGGIFSNSSANEDNCPAMHRRGSGEVLVENGGIGSIGSVGIFRDSGSSGSIWPTPVNGMEQESLPVLPIPDCSLLPPHGNVVINPGSTEALFPGAYEGIEIRGSSGNPTTVSMAPGIYCITTGGFSVSSATVTGTEVFIYLEGGEFNISASSDVYLTAPVNLYDSVGNFWAGMLIYMPEFNTSTVTLTGTSGSQFSGTILAPGPVSPSSKAKCTIIGTGEALTVNSQIICYTIEIGGDGNITMEYNADANFKLGSMMSLHE